MTYEYSVKEKPYEGKIFSVERLEITMPDRKTRIYDRIAIQNAVTILPIDSDGNVYFIRQYRIGSDSVLLELPAGKIENGEEALATAEREVREETGMAAGEMHSLGGFYMSPGYSTEYMHCFLATGLYPSPLTPDADEFLNLEKIPLEKIKTMIARGELPDSKTLAILMLAWEKLGKN